MVLGFIQHIWRYWFPETVDNGSLHRQAPSGIAVVSEDRHIEACYDENGHFIAYISRPKHREPKIFTAYTPSAIHIPTHRGGPSSAPIATLNIRPRLDVGSLEAEPNRHKRADQKRRNKALPPTPGEPLTSRLETALPVIPKKPKDWDGWPDGDWSHKYSNEFFVATGKLMSHWAANPKGGPKKGKGDHNAKKWRDGHATGRTCVGVIVCDNSNCDIVIRPQTRHAKRQDQLAENCRCAVGTFSHIDCGIVSWIWKYKNGVNYINGGTHAHPRPTYTLHLTQNQFAVFERIILANPKVTALPLLVGVPTIDGPGQSVADISPVLLNQDRIKAERRTVIRRAPTELGADSFIRQFAEFQNEHPGFVVHSTIGPITVVVMQTRYMASNLVNDQINDEAVNGIVTDAAHGYWQDPKALLLISSVYGFTLNCWVPALVSYTNGASENHYRLHFLALFFSIHEECQRRETVVDDSYLANVVDFSEAQRAGFITAFVDFRTEHPFEGELLTELELRNTAATLLKGCIQHFRSQITRVKRIGGVVPPALQQAFHNRVMALLDAPDANQLAYLADRLVKDFPRIKNWLHWWLRLSHAQMLFPAHRTMDATLAASIPESTNAEEAMHWKIYSALGKKLPLMQGLAGLYAFAQHYHTLTVGIDSGIKIRYGNPEPWKRTAAQIGRTKSHRDPKNHSTKASTSDGRPPDTVKQLLGTSKLAKVSPSSRESAVLPSYNWERNSCWIDSALQLIYVVAKEDYWTSFQPLFSKLSETDSLRHLAAAIDFRVVLDLEGTNLDSNIAFRIDKLSAQRDGFLRQLQGDGIVKHPYKFNPIFTWVGTLVNRDRGIKITETEDLARLYFEVYVVKLRACTGDTLTPQHWEVYETPHGHFHLGQLTIDLHKKFGGEVAKWFRDLVSVNKSAGGTPCWRTINGTCLCDGSALSLDIYVSIPIMLILEMGDDHDMRNMWNFPKHIRPLSQEAETTDGLVYDIVGRVFYSEGGAHFLSRFTDDGRRVFDYDDVADKGRAIAKKGAKVKTHLTGMDSKIETPDGFITKAVVYRLRGARGAQARFTRDQTAQSQRIHPVLEFTPSNPYKDKAGEYQLVPGTASEVPEAAGVEIPASELKHAASDLGKHVRSLSDETQQKEALAKRVWLADTLDHDDFDDTLAEDALEKRLGKRLGNPKLGAYQSAFAPMPLETEDMWLLNCRCGMEGDGRALSDGQDIIQCDICKDWSHLACQRGGKASSLKRSQKFCCDACLPPSVLPPRTRNILKRKKKLVMQQKPSDPLAKRLQPGKGALALSGKYWYPVRLIQYEQLDGEERQWRVQWWRGNEYLVMPEKEQWVRQSNIVDELWCNREGRRSIRLGKWRHASDTPQDEAIIAEFLDQHFTTEIDEAFLPYIPLLDDILHIPDSDTRRRIIPVLDWFTDNKDHKFEYSVPSGTVPYTGDLSPLEQAQVANWFYHNIPNTQTDTNKWLGAPVITHAYTILIATRNADFFMASYDLSDFQQANPDEQEAFLWSCAWEYLKDPDNIYKPVVDVDLECLAILEERMFENSARVGVSGNQQWGLDKGDNQGRWNPYMDLPEAWVPGDREADDDEEIKCGSQFSEDDTATPQDWRPRPQPRPIGLPLLTNL